MSVRMTDDVVDSARLHIHTRPHPAGYNITYTHHPSATTQATTSIPSSKPYLQKHKYTPSMSQQPTGTNNMDNPGLIAGHAQYVKGAAEVRLSVLP